MQCEGFSDVLLKIWSEENFAGFPLYRLVRKLKAVKKGLKLWISTNHFDSPKKHIDNIKLKLDSVQQQLDTILLDTDMHIEESNLTAQLEHWLALEESSLRQKGRDN